jgi:amino acid adenylation domain-containing protein
MSEATTLYELLDRSAAARPEHTAVEESDGRRIGYRALAELSDRVRDRLRRIGVAPGHRVGVYLHKSIDSLAVIFGILKTGAAYVPLDPGAPPRRNATILDDCSVAAAVVEGRLAEDLRVESEKLGALPALLLLGDVGGGVALREALEREDALDPAPAGESTPRKPEDLAYLLYTSGSTGKPKGVMISHRAALSFVDWCSETFQPTSEDRFSSHAPFHFDLSIHDIYVSIKHAATLVLVGERLGKDPQRLAELIAERRISIWYSAPSILSVLAHYGDLDGRDCSRLRTVLFAGEVFPVKHLRTLMSLLPGPRYFNLYGPTETNVCTWFEIPATFPDDRSEPFPIGQPCSNARCLVVDESGKQVAAGEEGELCVAGPLLMDGYWNLAERNAQAFLEVFGEGWYRTGDVVSADPEGNLRYLSRRDRMVKRRGYRIELGEIEAGLYRHPQVREAGVIALPDEEAGVRILACLACAGGKRLSVIALKRFCSETLPSSMIPDAFSFYESLPKTSTDKVDYQRLKESAS